MSSLDMLSCAFSHSAVGDCLCEMEGTPNSGRGGGTGMHGESCEEGGSKATGEDGCGLGTQDGCWLSTQDGCWLGAIDGTQDGSGLIMIDGAQDSA
jgi:hypothetical protein